MEIEIISIILILIHNQYKSRIVDKQNNYNVIAVDDNDVIVNRNYCIDDYVNDNGNFYKFRTCRRRGLLTLVATEKRKNMKNRNRNRNRNNSRVKRMKSRMRKSM